MLGSIDLGARCLMLEDPDHLVRGGKKRIQSSPCFNLILIKQPSKRRSTREAYASRFQLQAGSHGEKQSWLEAFEQCGVHVHKTNKRVHQLYVCVVCAVSRHWPLSREKESMVTTVYVELSWLCPFQVSSQLVFSVHKPIKNWGFNVP